MLEKHDQSARPTADQSAEAADNGSMMPQDIHSASLAVRLNRFMAAPQDPELERRFAARLLDVQLVALVSVGQAGKVTTAGATKNLKMSLGITTYLADGQKYIPVFTDAQVCQQFMRNVAPNVEMRSFSLTTGELMSEAERMHITGILVNPGKQSFPLTLTYWRYINRVQPVIQGDRKPHISLLTGDKLDRASALIKRAKHDRHMKRLWAVETTETKQESPSLTVIAGYTGSEADFHDRVAPSLARASKDILGFDQDVLVGTLSDELGQLVANQCAPIYTATKRFGRRRDND